MRTFKRFAVFGFVSCLFAVSGFAWGPEGHRIVAAIAFNHLSQTLRDQLDAILIDQDFVQVANFADDFRSSHPETKDWHFVDIPLSAAKYNAVRDCQQLVTGDCAVKELARAAAVLKDTTQSAKARRDALKFIIHFVGDIHQPLHSSTNGSRASGDRGGNSVNARLLTHTMNLHAVWDHGIIDLDNRDEGDYVDGLIADLVNKGKAADTGTVEDWANEAHAIAVTVGYKYPGFKINIIPTQTVTLNQAYANKGKAAVDLQLARAGVRLARLLTECLTGTT